MFYNELCVRDFSVDVGIVEYCYKDAEKKSKRAYLEIDFIANKGSKKYYVQSALTVTDEEKREQEIRSLKRVGDSFKKIVVVKDNIIPWHDDDGILYIGIEQLSLDENAMDMWFDLLMEDIMSNPIKDDFDKISLSKDISEINNIKQDISEFMSR